MFPLYASFKNDENNGLQMTKQASTLFEVGQFIVSNGLGQVYPYAAQTLVQFPTSSGTFTVGETVTGGTSGTTATVVSVDGSNTYLYVDDIVAIAPFTGFVVGETITGSSSAATAVVSVSTELNKIIGISNQQITTASADYADTDFINLSTPANVMDYVDVPVSIGSATQSLVGTYVDVDPATSGTADVSTPGSQLFVTRVVDANNIVAAIALTIAS